MYVIVIILRLIQLPIHESYEGGEDRRSLVCQTSALS